MNKNQHQLPTSASSAKMLCKWLAAMTLIGQLAQAGTGFTYQGRLFIGDVPANGLYDLQFTNYDAGGNALGGFNTNALPVTNGLFTVTLDFGAVFDGTPRWLEISERTNNVGAFATLAPRQLLAAAPYATYAASAGSVPGLTILQNADGEPNVIAGSPLNWVATGVEGATIGGGGAVGLTNSVSAYFGTIGGGEGNTIQATAVDATIGGGANNVIQTEADFAIIGGGYGNKIQTNSSGGTVGGGQLNTILTNGYFATIPGGINNSATNHAFAAGTQAQAVNQGSFVWADFTWADFSSTADNQFAVRAKGGVRFVTSGAGMTVDGAVTATAFNTSSDRNLKEHLGAVNPREVLNQVASVPIWRWNFKADAGTPHIGPMAQDFYAAFSVGSDDRHIATVDADGVALAAIQGLNQKLEETRAENADLRARLEKLERLVQSPK